MDKNLKKITELKIKCKNCDTKIITKIGNVIKTCPQCGIKFIDENLGYNLFEILTELFKSVSKNKSAEFYFVCKKECDGTRNRQDKKV
ncbi:hypothetical protein QJG41_000151 [Campylobacter jejuni]|nr:hypothetical protein [Campylobacter jejuni]